MANKGKSSPFVVQAGTGAGDDIPSLISWIKDNQKVVDKEITRAGAILFRGFNPASAQDFEDVVLAFDGTLREDYLGTSARRKLTRYVYTASEMPRFFPIPQHCELSFSKSYPPNIYFCCRQAPQDCGETPLCDFRKVYNDVPVALREKWDKKGLKYYRNYGSKNSKKWWDPLSYKSWEEVFETTNKSEVEKICEAENYTVQWLPGNMLRLTNLGPVSKVHPVTKERVWFNHAHIFHDTVQYDEYRCLKDHLPRHFLWSLLFFFIGMIVYMFKSIIVNPEQGATYCTFADGTKIPKKELSVVRDAMWKNMIVNPWQTGDIIFVDNHSMSHGRLPFSGPRSVIVCMAKHVEN